MDDYIIGIDLGTTKSGVAVFRNNKSEIIPDISGSRLIPSNVTFRDKEILIGDINVFRSEKNIKFIN